MLTGCTKLARVPVQSKRRRARRAISVGGPLLRAGHTTTDPPPPGAPSVGHAVLLQACKDAVHPTVAAKHRDDARRFLSNDDGSLSFWCDVSMVRVDKIMAAAARLWRG